MLNEIFIGDPRMPFPPHLLSSLPAWNMMRSSIVCPSSRELPIWSYRSESSLIQGGQEGHPTLHEQDGVFTVTDGEGNVRFDGNEVAAEFAYWRTTFGVPVDDSEVGDD
ncbi:MAG: hypothetical protein E6J34_00885 [Chloroflexi bacterium]|nr:MAG: hypothetical protein E6J34_00885 [Chloroflexota bacterium]